MIAINANAMITQCLSCGCFTIKAAMRSSGRGVLMWSGGGGKRRVGISGESIRLWSGEAPGPARQQLRGSGPGPGQTVSLFYIKPDQDHFLKLNLNQVLWVWTEPWTSLMMPESIQVEAEPQDQSFCLWIFYWFVQDQHFRGFYKQINNISSWC